MKIVRETSLSADEMTAKLAVKTAEYETLQLRFNALIAHRPAEAAALTTEMVDVLAQIRAIEKAMGLAPKAKRAARPISQTELCLRLGLN